MLQSNNTPLRARQGSSPGLVSILVTGADEVQRATRLAVLRTASYLLLGPSHIFATRAFVQVSAHPDALDAADVAAAAIPARRQRDLFVTVMAICMPPAPARRRRS